MSKAFTREDDREEIPGPKPRRAVASKNYLTPDGAARLRLELEKLMQVERPAVTGRAGDDEMRVRLQVLDGRIRELEEVLDSATVVAPPLKPWDTVRFGATVTMRDQQGEQIRYRIVGVDETYLSPDWISWCSPLAQALQNGRVGDKIRFRAPGGEQALEIITVSYEAN